MKDCLESLTTKHLCRVIFGPFSKYLIEKILRQKKNLVSLFKKKKHKINLTFKKTAFFKVDKKYI